MIHSTTCTKCQAHNERAKVLSALPLRVGISNKLTRGEAVERELNQLYHSTIQCEAQELDEE